MTAYPKLIFRLHALARMALRGFHPDGIRANIRNAETVEEYPDDLPYPSYLLLLWIGDRPVHVVSANNNDDFETVIITVYEPDPLKWSDGFKRRKA